jgi:hypothetical protein
LPRRSFNGGRIHKTNQIYLYDDKTIYFPEDRNVTLTVSQSQDCAKTCRGGATTDFFLLDYNIENGGSSTSWTSTSRPKAPAPPPRSGCTAPSSRRTLCT